MKYTDEDLIRALQNLAETLGSKPTAAENQAHPATPSTQTYTRRFGSWNEALEAAGFRAGPLTEDDLTEMIRDLADDLDRVPTVGDVNDAEDLPHVWTFQDRFGTWNEAVRAAGFDANPGSNIDAPDDDDLLEALADLTRELGRVPTRDEMDERGRYGTTVYQRRFGGWKSALRELGLSRDSQLADFDRRTLIEELREFANYGGRGPTASVKIRDMRHRGPHSYNVYNS
ncbi:homing endonuclease associated repeat-containing protein [Haloferax sulfurifontis]|uniref:Uncharacterized protein n=2 Tax=Haloferax sulfurifontis TaxID=255616 RepID=M0III9_9EURY|nr:hypothetical protein [Haloferax sulfurifontis]ELZ96560.1 hypothetical protein C441_04309 [Haloferax sulfurifontis ATCC BAA-897]GGC72889.1 hypothetical protein GCM10007209_38550 [Haloferax sulfurifontis]